MPRQDLKRPKEMAEISHLWAEWYLIYTLLTPFEGELPDEMRALFVMQGAFVSNLEETVLKVEMNLEETE